MRSGQTIKIKDLCQNKQDINEVVIYPQLNKYHTLFWKVEGLFGSYRFTLCLTQDKEEALSFFAMINEKLLDIHEEDLRSRLY